MTDTTVAKREPKAALKVRETGAALDISVRNRMATLIAQAPVEEEGEGLNRMLDRILTCESIDQLAAMFEKMDNSRTVAGRNLKVDGFVIRASKYTGENSRLGIYATVFATDRDTNEDVTFNVGAQTVVVSLLVANVRQWFPFFAHIELKELSDGNTASNLMFD